MFDGPREPSSRHVLNNLSRQLGCWREDLIDRRIVLNEDAQPVDLWCGPERARSPFVKRLFVYSFRAADPDVLFRLGVKLGETGAGEEID